MRLVGLISGGKDSIFNMLQCISAGHEISAVANIEPEHKVELDSYMYQSVGHEALTLIAGALSLPIYRYKTKGKAICLDKVYVPTPNDEVEDLYELLKTVKKEMNIEGVSVGAIASDYQRTRVENVCHRLNLRCFAFLWRRDQAELLQEMIDSELDAIIIKVASIGLDPKVHLGMHVTDLKDNLMELNRKFGVNICGEGGEYETLTLDCPLFHRAIDITDVENVILSDAAFAPVGFLNIKGAELKVKVSRNDDPVKSSQARLEHIRTVVKNPYYYVQDCLDTITAYYFEEERWKIIVEILEQIFPDGRNVDSSIEEIPFPFHTPPKPSDTLTSISGYWKKGEPSHVSSSLQGMTSKSSVAFPTTSSSLIYSTGWCCIGNIVSASGAEALSLLKKHLERINYTFEDIVFVNVFLRDMNEFSNFNKIYSNFMPDVSPPSRVCVGTQLPSNVGIIMLVVAHKLVSRSQKALHSAHVLEKEVMHVQSISNWAPANIGPYSQCVKIGEIYYLAGQIPLVPGTMEIFNKPLYHQCLLALRHVVRVLEAMHEQFSYSNILQAICYVVSESLASDVNSLWSYIAKNRNATVTALVVKDLPRKAQLEWEVIACGSKDLQAKEVTQTTEDFIIQMKHCICVESPALSFMCKVSFPKRINKDEKNLKIITESGIQTVINICVQQAKSEFKHFESFLCILKLYYKCNETILGPVIRNVVKLYFDSKVVLTAIPVISCEEPDVILTITGICH